MRNERIRFFRYFINLHDTRLVGGGRLSSDGILSVYPEFGPFVGK